MCSGSIYAAIAGFCGLAAGWLAIDFFTRRRDKEDRAGVFIGHLLCFRSVIARKRPDDRKGIWEAYLEVVSSYHRELGKIRRDYLCDKPFLSLTDELGNLQESEIAGFADTDARDPICDKIDKLGEMLERRKGGWAGQALK
jgi:hypothetical protein